MALWSLADGKPLEVDARARADRRLDCLGASLDSGPCIPGNLESCGANVYCHERVDRSVE